MTPSQEPEHGSGEAIQEESELKGSVEALNASKAVVSSGLERERKKKNWKSEKKKAERR